MTDSTNRAFQRLERQKQALVSDVLSASAARMRTRPEPASWCMLEVLDHLVKTEEACLTTVRRNLPHGHPVLLKDRFGTLMVNSVMRSPMRVKAPASAKTVIPEATADAAAVVQRWGNLREKMEDLLKRMPQEQMSCGVFRHPVAGWMTMRGAMAFLSAHLRHHEYQLNRLKRATAGL